MVDVPVASLQLLYQGAFGDCLATQKPVWTHVVGKRGEQKLSKPQHYPKNIVFYSVNHSVIG